MASRKKVKKGEEFVFCNGASAASLAECSKELAKLSPQDFSFHVNESKNDIYNWIRDCLDPELAKKLEKVRNKEKLISLLKQA
jgi:hypothetical protein